MLSFASIISPSITLKSFKLSAKSEPKYSVELLSPAFNVSTITANRASISSFIARLSVNAFISSRVASIP